MVNTIPKRFRKLIPSPLDLPGWALLYVWKEIDYIFS